MYVELGELARHSNPRRAPKMVRSAILKGHRVGCPATATAPVPQWRIKKTCRVQLGLVELNRIVNILLSR